MLALNRAVYPLCWWLGSKLVANACLKVVAMQTVDLDVADLFDLAVQMPLDGVQFYQIHNLLPLYIYHFCGLQF
jgi:hypothetical protein